MKNGVVGIRIFEMLDSVWKASKGRLNDGDWADAAEIHQSRISAYRKKVELHYLGEDDSHIGRAFTVANCIALYEGLKRLLGEDAVKKEILALLDKAKTRKERLFLMLLVMDEEYEEQLEMYMKVFFSKSK